ncbi:aminodeoxychorismate/anthranilate synthase component II [Lichenihabitans sp. PAMC28606]|uniref:anthranilate synthase component II n=1 Tax=Lichenihabitans sp. PAMC28606 TaxID=2880932 RepID=UPI001D09E15C|nr:aminodeoxychorismate/anthranilate synthase component II [Lichenihabitans sp. PAMC28606]UDL96126.1 aminodeoxychorismate/anthranilate synthase component II [Lichenihabitans sp. PAMC28606]
MILIVDNYDSFVFNVSRTFEELGQATRVVRNDAIDAAGVEASGCDALVISPGPCGPEQAGASLDLIARFNGHLPILGICLGHQCIGQAFGARVVRAGEPMHGRASPITHDGDGLFEGLPNPVMAGRYHALIVEIDQAETSPLRVTARSSSGEIMGLAHRDTVTMGVQFHPESVLTEGGHALLANFLRLAARWRAGAQPCQEF